MRVEKKGEGGGRERKKKRDATKANKIVCFLT